MKKKTICITILLYVCYILQVFIEQIATKQELYSYVYYHSLTISHKLFISPFLHISIKHLVTNSISFLIFGLIIEYISTRKKYYSYILFGSIIPILIQMYYYQLLNQPAYVLGFSAVVYTFTGALIYRIGNIFETKYTIYYTITTTMIITLYLGSKIHEPVAQIAHISGLYLGLILSIIFQKIQYKIRSESILEIVTSHYR